MYTRIRRLIVFLVGFSIPIQAESVSLGPVRATPFKLVVIALLLLAGLQFASRTGSRTADRKGPWVLAFGVSWAMALTMSLVAGLPAERIFQAGSTLISLVAFYFLMGFAVRSRDDFSVLLWSLALSGMVTAFPAVVGLQAPSGEMAYGDRFVGLSGQENRFGADMTVCMAIAFGLFFTMRSLMAKGVLVACALFALGGVALSLSRAAFLALGCMWVFWLYRSGRVGAIRWVIPGLLLAVGVALWSPASVEHRFQTMVNPELRARDESIQGRFVMGVWAMKAFVSNPLIGVGGMRFPTWVHDQPGNQGLAWHTIHNAYLSIAAEQGLFGLIPFIMILGLTWLDYSKCWRVIHARRLMRDPQLQEFASWVLFLQLALLGRIVSAFFHQTHQSKTLWTILAVSPVVVGLVRTRVAQLAGAFPQEEPATFLSPAPTPPLSDGGVPVR